MSLTITTSGAVNVELSGTFVFVDPTGYQSNINKVIPELIASLSASEFGQAALTTTPAAITLPATPTQLFYMKNLSASFTVTVTWTPVGQTSAVVQVVQPGGILFFFNPGNGISALSVVASGNANVDYVLAG
jgi:hypothetical protein